MNKENALKPVKQSTIFVDCFQTVILRKLSTKQVLKLWAKNLEDKLKIDWKYFYKTYNKINFKLSFKKLITKFVLEEKFEVVLLNVYERVCIFIQKNYSQSSAFTSTHLTALLSILIFVLSPLDSIRQVSSLMLMILPMIPPMVVISSPTSSELRMALASFSCLRWGRMIRK